MTKKYITAHYLNGYVIRLPNRRIEVCKYTKKSGEIAWLINAIWCHPKGTDLSTYEHVLKNRITVSAFVLSEEAFKALTQSGVDWYRHY